MKFQHSLGRSRHRLRFQSLQRVIVVHAAAAIAATGAFAQPQRPITSNVQARLQTKLAKGWNTWNTNSVTSHVLLPEGFALNLGLKKVSIRSERYLTDPIIGRPGKNAEQIFLGMHAYDGSYTEIEIAWQGLKLKLETAVDNEDLVVLVTPLRSEEQQPPLLILESALLWNRPGSLSKKGDTLEAKLPARVINVFPTKQNINDLSVPTKTAYLALKLDTPVGISTGPRRNLREIANLVKRNRDRHSAHLQKLGRSFAPAQAAIAWNTIYDPKKERVFITQSRLFNQLRGGYAVWSWDTFFASLVAAIDNKDLAYANVIEFLNTENRGSAFVKSVTQGNGRETHDRSQPPVGSLVIKEIYRKYREKWFAEEVFERLLSWNRWWATTRLNRDGLLSWGSDRFNDPWKDGSVNTIAAAKYESGLDNSPMYDDIPFNNETSLMELSDVGLNSLYIADCDALSWLAGEIGRDRESAELKARADKFRERLQDLWNEEHGIFLNRRTDTNEWSTRLSPMLFYPLLAQAATEKQAQRMIHDHLLSSEEFWGEWVIPSIARNDPAFKDQDYWRGRIWPPSNFLVYLGLRNYGFPEVRKDLAAKSEKLLLKGWDARRHVNENYNAITGEGDEANKPDSLYPMSEPFHSWSSLLALIGMFENDQFYSSQAK